MTSLADLEKQAESMAEAGKLAMAEHRLHLLQARICRSEGKDFAEAERRAEDARRRSGVALAAARCLRDAIELHRKTFAALGFDPDFEPEPERPRPNLRIVGRDI